MEKTYIVTVSVPAFGGREPFLFKVKAIDAHEAEGRAVLRIKAEHKESAKRAWENDHCVHCFSDRDNYTAKATLIADMSTL